MINRNSEEYNQLILDELKGIKEELRDVRQELLNNANECSDKRHNMKDNFVSSDLFWKVFSFVAFVISGSYGYTTFIYSICHK